MRRRKKNSLLPKMIVIAVLVNAIVLPILAQLGVFKGSHGRAFDQVRLVTLPPEKKTAPKRVERKKRVAKAKPRRVERPSSRQPARVASRPNPNQPKVVAAAAPGDSGAAIDNSGTAQPGQLPVSPPQQAPTPVAAAPAPPPPAAPNVPPPAPKPAPAPPTALPPPHVPVIVAAEPLSQPEPQLPSDLTYEDIRSNFQAVFSIQASGTVSVKMVASTGNPRLDQLALNAARQWTFRPATVDGKPVDSFRRLAVEFYPT